MSDCVRARWRYLARDEAGGLTEHGGKTACNCEQADLGNRRVLLLSSTAEAARPVMGKKLACGAVIGQDLR